MSTSTKDDDERAARDRGFLEAIGKDPNDEPSRLVYADWLEESGAADYAEFLRLENQLFTIPARLREIRARLDPSWLHAVGRRIDLWLLSTPNKIAAIKLVRELKGLGLKDAKDLVDSAPVAVATDLTIDEAIKLEKRFVDQAYAAMEARHAEVRLGPALAWAFAPVDKNATSGAKPREPGMRVVLVSYAFPWSDYAKRIALLKAVRAVTNLGLAEAKALVDSLPKTLREEISTEEANQIKAQFEGIAEARIEPC